MAIEKHVSLNLHTRGLGNSATLAINEKCAMLKKKGKTIYNFGLGQSPFPVPGQVVETLRVHAHEKNYLPVKGLPELRSAVSEFHNRIDHVKTSPDMVLVGPGSKELLFLLQLAFYGEIYVPAPCWVSYVPQSKILGKKVHLIQTKFRNKWHITADEFAGVLEGEQDTYKPRILVLNYPGNPDGLTYTTSELKDIAKVARDYEVIILSDEIYGRLHHKGEHVSIARFYPNGTIISSGLSKWCGAGGWRLGTFTFPEDLNWLMDTMAAVASETYTSVSAPIQYAAVRAFLGTIKIERYLWNVRRILSKLGNHCAKKLKDARVRLHYPEGAFYLFLDFSPFKKELNQRKIRDSTALCHHLLNETGCALLPGVVFERPKAELTARLAYVDFDGAAALSASERIPISKELSDEFIRKRCEETVTGVQRMVDWLHNGH